MYAFGVKKYDTFHLIFTIRHLYSSSLDDNPDEESRDCYNQFLHILEDYDTENDYEENHDHVSPVEFLKIDLKLFDRVFDCVEPVIHGMLCAAVRV